MARTATFARRIAQVGVIVGVGVRVTVADLVGVRLGAGGSVTLGSGVLVAVEVGRGVKETVGEDRVAVGSEGAGLSIAWQAGINKMIASQASRKHLLNT